MMNTSDLGSRTEGIVLAALLRVGKRVLLPFGGGVPYDLVIDEGSGVFVRVQCKTAVYQGGCVLFRAHTLKRNNTQVGYRGIADVFGVYCPALDKIYIVPVDDVNDREGRLRVDPTRNNQAQKIRWAAQYELT